MAAKTTVTICDNDIVRLAVGILYMMLPLCQASLTVRTLFCVPLNVVAVIHWPAALGH